MAPKRPAQDKGDTTPAKRGCRKLQQLDQNLHVTVPSDSAKTGNDLGLSVPNQPASSVSSAGVQQAPLLVLHVLGSQQVTLQQPAMPSVWPLMWNLMKGQYMIGQSIPALPEVTWMLMGPSPGWTQPQFLWATRTQVV